MKSVDITTTQNVTITYQLGSLWQRILGFILDVVILFAAYWLIMLLLGISLAFIGSGFVRIIAMSFPFLFLGYFIVSGIYLNGQTLGKKALNLKIMKYNGREIQVGTVLIREIFLFVEVMLTLGTLGALLIGASDRNQRLGDILANTVVVNLNTTYSVSLQGLTSLKTPEEYTPEYPQVTQLSEDDLILVKQVIDRVNYYPSKAHQLAVDKLANVIEDKLNISRGPHHAQSFLERLSQDYVVLTR